MAKEPLMCKVPRTGYVWNPLLRHEVNAMCLCGSNVKFKKCCMRKMPECIPGELAKDFQGKTKVTQYMMMAGWLEMKMKENEAKAHSGVDMASGKDKTVIAEVQDGKVISSEVVSES